ncbi:MAG: T9SS type A sorting domain-containing protein [Chitinophagales bacterium]|nr:T9SS type A sorting domain-containing protein [Chitinophagales bacterium]
MPLYVNTPISINNLNLEIDSFAEIENQNTISIDKNLINHKDSLASIGNISFDGNQTQTLYGKPITFEKLLLNKTASTLEVNTNIIVEDTLQLNSGIVDLNFRTLNLGTTAYISNETDEHYITGFGSKIITQRSINNPTDDNIGGIGATITSTQNLGLTTIERVNISFTIFGLTSASRNYKITPSNNSSLDATLKLQYLTNELNGLQQSTLAVYQSLDNGSNWSLLSTNLDTLSNTITTTSMNSFKMYTFSDFTATPLPVELISFDAKNIDNQKALLQWQTASEINNDYFEIERASDDLNFTTISEKIFSKGNGSETHNYDFYDMEPLNGINYYRLKQVDLDGSFEYSDIRKVAFNSVNEAIFSSKVFPTVIKRGENLNISTSELQNHTKFLYLFAENGQLLEQVNFNGTTYSYPIDQNLQSGVYFVSLSDGNRPFSTNKIIITE